MSQVTTHVLDTAAGRPAAGILVRLLADGELLASGETDADGRVSDLGPEALAPGDYRLEFDVATPYFPRITIDFKVTDASHHHVPVLLSPYGYTTYRGS
ncbi:hydroxyisourate hydrolase [Pseudolysinimonas sp.]|uniref:hydroxyisourate hydrolase n=1 Tax=Pseudolysinimonas sp. TaxID=2680009 RepID=UPI00286C9CE3|nr:hydroxyisourate hydrolase [Pseudolysinimonas sp.]